LVDYFSKFNSNLGRPTVYDNIEKNADEALKRQKELWANQRAAQVSETLANRSIQARVLSKTSSDFEQSMQKMLNNVANYNQLYTQGL